MHQVLTVGADPAEQSTARGSITTALIFQRAIHLVPSESRPHLRHQDLRRVSRNPLEPQIAADPIP
jgi:hypothetical protein